MCRFLRQVFQVFAENSLSIDMVATSEVSISLTLDQEQDRGDLLRYFPKILLDNAQKKCLLSLSMSLGTSQGACVEFHIVKGSTCWTGCRQPFSFFISFLFCYFLSSYFSLFFFFFSRKKGQQRGRNVPQATFQEVHREAVFTSPSEGAVHRQNKSKVFVSYGVLLSVLRPDASRGRCRPTPIFCGRDSAAQPSMELMTRAQ